MRTLTSLLTILIATAGCSETSESTMEPVPLDPVEATFATSAPLPGVLVDGVLDHNEWKNSRSWPDLAIRMPEGGTATGHLYVRNDLDNIYFGFVLDAEVPWDVSNIVVRFFNDGVGPLAVGDDYVIGYARSVAGSGNDIYDGYFDQTPTGFRGIGDEYTGGTQDGAAAGRIADGQTVIEIQHPLDSGDDAHDISVAPGEMVQFLITATILRGPNDAVQTTPLPWQPLYISCKRNQKVHGPDRPPRC